MKRMLIVALALAAAVPTTPASATYLLGATVKVFYNFPSLSESPFFPADTIVGTSGPTLYNGIASATVDDRTLTLDAFCGPGCVWESTSFNGFVLVDFYGTLPRFQNAMINPATSYAGFDASRIIVNEDDIQVNWQGLTGNGHIVLDINVGVPEPQSWTMLITGFGLTGAAMRRRARRHA